MSVSTGRRAARGLGDHLRQAVIGLRADDHVDHLRARHGFGALGLGDAAGERDHRPRAVVAAQAADVRIGLLGGLLADVAGVEHDQVGVLAVGGRGHAFGAEQLGHALAVIDVHLAAEGLDLEGFGERGHVRGGYRPAGAELEAAKRARRSRSRAWCASTLRSSLGGRAARGDGRLTGSVPLRPSTRRTLSLPLSSYQPTSIAAGAIIDRHRPDLDAAAAAGRRREQGRAERQQMVAGPGRAFGEQSERLRALERARRSRSPGRAVALRSARSM